MSSVTLDPAVDELRSRFLDVTGYGDRDIVAFNPSTRIFLTRNGGRYQMTELNRVLHLAGPSPEPTERM